MNKIKVKTENAMIVNIYKRKYWSLIWQMLTETKENVKRNKGI